MKLLAGLGNPGTKYAHNRHNVGFMVVDAIARKYSLPTWRKKFQAETTDGMIDGHKVLVMKPTTYMNESGRALGEVVRFYNLNLDDVFVFHDELDLPAGKMRTKKGGGHAGNNGIRSIKAHIGDDFHRVRIGVGHPGDKAQVAQHVLKDFSKSDNLWLPEIIDTIASNVGLLIGKDAASFQNKVHLTMAPIMPRNKKD